MRDEDHKVQVWHVIDDFVQDYSISSALAIELLQFCTEPPK